MASALVGGVDRCVETAIGADIVEGEDPMAGQIQVRPAATSALAQPGSGKASLAETCRCAEMPPAMNTTGAAAGPCTS